MKKLLYAITVASFLLVNTVTNTYAQYDPNSNPLTGLCPEDHLDTAIGCIPLTGETALFGFFLRWGLGIAGGIAFLLIIYATFQIMTSSGDPKKMQAGKELLTAAISGVVLLIFSVFILRIIAGPSLLNIPFFN